MLNHSCLGIFFADLCPVYSWKRSTETICLCTGTSFCIILGHRITEWLSLEGPLEIILSDSLFLMCASYSELCPDVSLMEESLLALLANCASVRSPTFFIFKQIPFDITFFLTSFVPLLNI